MAGLRDLLQIGAAEGGVELNFDTLYVYNTSKASASNGGQCCLWTVPAGVSWFAVELWGGGGAGPGSCCCQQGWGGGSGSYARKFITGLSGDGGEQFRLCAAGSTGCCCACCSQPGYPSYVFDVSASSVPVCASGGASGRTRCFAGDNCGSCWNCTGCNCGSWTGGMGICGVNGSFRGNPNCHGNAWSYAPSAPFTGGGLRGSRTWCSADNGITQNGEAHWPGGGGGAAVTHGGSGCYGGPGAGGLINIFYGVAG